MIIIDHHSARIRELIWSISSSKTSSNSHCQLFPCLIHIQIWNRSLFLYWRKNWFEHEKIIDQLKSDRFESFWTKRRSVKKRYVVKERLLLRKFPWNLGLTFVDWKDQTSIIRSKLFLLKLRRWFNDRETSLRKGRIVNRIIHWRMTQIKLTLRIESNRYFTNKWVRILLDGKVLWLIQLTPFPIDRFVWSKDVSENHFSYR